MANYVHFHTSSNYYISKFHAVVGGPWTRSQFLDEIKSPPDGVVSGATQLCLQSYSARGDWFYLILVILSFVFFHHTFES